MTEYVVAGALFVARDSIDPEETATFVEDVLPCGSRDGTGNYERRDAQAEAEKRRLEAEGEASAIYAKLEAEARGQYEILAKKGEGLKQIVEACGGSTQAFQMLMLEHLDNLAEASSRAISNIKFDKVVVWDGGGPNSATSGFLQSMANTLPPMMHVLRDIAGVELIPALDYEICHTNIQVPLAGKDDVRNTPVEPPAATEEMIVRSATKGPSVRARSSVLVPLSPNAFLTSAARPQMCRTR
jgi:hypothetical protein